MKVRELFEREGDYFLPKSIAAAKEDLVMWVEMWEEDQKFEVHANWKKNLAALAKEYLALVKSEIMTAVDYTTHEENVVDMREEEAIKVFKKHKMIAPVSKEVEDAKRAQEIKWAHTRNVGDLLYRVRQYNKLVKKGKVKANLLPIPRKNSKALLSITVDELRAFNKGYDEFDDVLFDEGEKRFMKDKDDWEWWSGDAATLWLDQQTARRYVGPQIRKLFKKHKVK